MAAKRVPFPDDLSIAFMRVPKDERPSIQNGNTRGRRFIVTIRRNGQSFSFPYMRGYMLSNMRQLDPFAAMRQAFVEIGLLNTSPGSLSADSTRRLRLVEAGFKRVFGEEAYTAAYQTTLHNVQELVPEEKREETAGTPNTITGLVDVNQDGQPIRRVFTPADRAAIQAGVAAMAAPHAVVGFDAAAPEVFLTTRTYAPVSDRTSP